METYWYQQPLEVEVLDYIKVWITSSISFDSVLLGPFFCCVKANPSLTRYMPSKIPHSQHVVLGDPRAHFCHHLPARSQ